MPSDVTLGWAGWETTKETLAFATFPTRLEALTLDNPDAFEAIKRPLIVRPVKVPTEVMLGWAGCETTRATLEFATFPTRLEALTLDSPDAFEAIKSPWTVSPVDTVIFGMSKVSKRIFTFVALAVNTLGTESEAVFVAPETFRDVSIPTDVILGWAG